MNLTERIVNQFVDSLENKQHAVDCMMHDIEAAADLMTMTLLADGKILTCGNGLCHLEATRLATLLCHRFERERPGLPALTLNADPTLLTAVANGYHFNEVYSKQITALGNDNDLLVVFSTTGTSPALLQAVQSAHERGMRVLALTGNDGGDLASVLTDDDMEMRVPSERSARILEVFMVLNHCLADLLDAMIFGFEED